MNESFGTRILGRPSLLGQHGYGYSQTPDRLKGTYEGVYHRIANRKAVDMADFPGASPKDVSLVLSLIDMDHPELFWMDGYRNLGATAGALYDMVSDEKTYDAAFDAMSEGIDLDRDGKISFFERGVAASGVLLEENPVLKWAIKDRLSLSPLWTQRRINATQKQMDDYVRDCYQGIPSGASEYQAYRHVFEHIVRTTTYRLRKAKKSQDVRSVFVGHESVCRGYAEALQYLLLGLGIECFTVTGLAKDRSGASVGHAWNYVKIDGVWNAVDVTFADWDLDDGQKAANLPEALRKAFVDYRYMSMTEDDVNDRVPIDVVGYPETGNTGDYFQREGYVLHEGAGRALARICTRLHNGDETFVLAQVEDGVDGYLSWLNRVFSQVVRVCVAAGGIDRLEADFAGCVEGAKEVTLADIERAGWKGFSLKTNSQPDSDVVLTWMA